jgi:hypothetical protein
MVDDFFGSPWGGPWTQQKLTCLRRYLLEYRKIFKANPRARYYSTWFVDAFAGTGSRPKAVCQSALNIDPRSASKIDPAQVRHVPVVHRGDPRVAECPMRRLMQRHAGGSCGPTGASPDRLMARLRRGS